MHEIFDALDENHDGNISYVQLLADTNFNEFFKKYSKESAADIEKQNDRDQQIIISQKEEIEKLKVWIDEKGKPSRDKAERLQIETESLHHELSAYRLEIDTMKSEMLRI